MATGTVDFFTDSRGYGDIGTAETEEDVFFHMEDGGGLDLKEERTWNSGSSKRRRGAKSLDTPIERDHRDGAAPVHDRP